MSYTKKRVAYLETGETSENRNTHSKNSLAGEEKQRNRAIAEFEKIMKRKAVLGSAAVNITAATPKKKKKTRHASRRARPRIGKSGGKEKALNQKRAIKKR